MRLVPTQEQVDLQEILHGLLAKQCPPTLVREVKEPDSSGLPPALWSVLVDAGVLGLAIDEEYDGAGAGLLELGVFYSEAGRVLCPTAVYSSLALGLAIQRLGTDEQRHKYLPSLVAGEVRGTVAAWNPSDAADLRGMLTASRVEGGWHLNGTLPTVIDEESSDVVFLTAATDEPNQNSRLIGCFVEPNSAGWRSRTLTTMAGDKQSRVDLADVLVVDAQVTAGSDDQGLAEDDVAWVAQAVLALQCMEMSGGTSAVLDRTVTYAKEREQFNRAIGSFQAVQHLLADVHIALDAARLSATAAVGALDRGKPDTRAVAIAKMHASEAYKLATLTAHQIHGGMGYVRETDLHLWSERAKVAEVTGGTADVAARWLRKEIGLG